MKNGCTSEHEKLKIRRTIHPSTLSSRENRVYIKSIAWKSWQILCKVKKKKKEKKNKQYTR